MTQPRLVSITVRLPAEWVRNLEALVDPEHGLDDVAAVLTELADHAQQGVCRPGAWERGWPCQALGWDTYRPPSHPTQRLCRTCLMAKRGRHHERRAHQEVE